MAHKKDVEETLIDRETQLIALHKQGLRDTQIARIMEMTQSSVNRMRNRLGLPPVTTRTQPTKPKPYVPPVPASPDGNSRISGPEWQAAQVVDNPALLIAVLERACKICPGLVRDMLEETDHRLSAVLNGGYIERYGAK